MLFKIILSPVTALVVYIPPALQHTTKIDIQFIIDNIFRGIASEIMFYFYSHFYYSDIFYYFYVVIECIKTGYILTCRKW